MKNWPWITIVLALALMLNPLGFDVIYSALMSGEALSRNIWQPIVLVIVVILILHGLIEWAFKRMMVHRRAQASAPARAGVHERMES